MTSHNEIQHLIPSVSVANHIPKGWKQSQYELPYLVANGEHIPSDLKASAIWRSWKLEDNEIRNRKPKKQPYGNHGRTSGWQAPECGMTFNTALTQAMALHHSGIGVVLPARINDRWLVALDFDRVNSAARVEFVENVRQLLDNPYVEYSPSKHGMHIFLLSDERVAQAQYHNASSEVENELFCDRPKFVTVTGDIFRSGRGIPVNTDAAVKLSAEWGLKHRAKSDRADAKLSELPSILLPARELTKGTLSQCTISLGGLLANNEEGQTILRDLLRKISPSLSRPLWMRCIWAAMSTGVDGAIEIARDWSKLDQEKYSGEDFDGVVHSFDKSRSPGLGSLKYLASIGEDIDGVAISSIAADEEKATPTQKSRLLTWKELQSRPTLDWLVHNLLPSKGLASIYGKSGTGKSFLAIDLVCAVALGKPWFNAKVRSTAVVYVILEGAGGITNRILAWAKHQRHSVPNNVRFVVGNFTLLTSADALSLSEEIAADVGGGALVVIDTLNQASPGADENSSIDMGKVISNSKLVAELVNGITLLVHHAGKDVGKGMRGHSSLFAAMDTVIEVSKGPNGYSWQVAKSKDSESGVGHTFELIPYNVGQTPDGDPITSCAIRPTIRLATAAAKLPTGKHQKVALKVLPALLRQSPNGLPVQVAIQALANAIDCDDDKRVSRATEVVKSLTAAGHYHQKGTQLLLPEGGSSKPNPTDSRSP